MNDHTLDLSVCLSVCLSLHLSVVDVMDNGYYNDNQITRGIKLYV